MLTELQHLSPLVCTFFQATEQQLVSAQVYGFSNASIATLN